MVWVETNTKVDVVAAVVVAGLRRAVYKQCQKRASEVNACGPFSPSFAASYA